jgi:hypothetical protein
MARTARNGVGGDARHETFGRQLSSHKQHPPHPFGGLCYDKRHVWALTVAVTIPHKLLCGLRGGFNQEKFPYKPLVGKFSRKNYLL